MERELDNRENVRPSNPGQGVLHGQAECACTAAGFDSRLAALLIRHPREKSALLAVLQAVQEEFGFLPREALTAIAGHVRAPDGKVFGVATFYNRFRLTPTGKHPIKVCMGTACHMAGGKLVLDAAERELEIKVGGITPDGEYSLERVACVGCCALAPVMLVGDEVHPHMAAFKAEEVLTVLKSARSKPEAEEEAR